MHISSIVKILVFIVVLILSFSLKASEGDSVIWTMPAETSQFSGSSSEIEIDRELELPEELKEESLQTYTLIVGGQALLISKVDELLLY